MQTIGTMTDVEESSPVKSENFAIRIFQRYVPTDKKSCSIWVPVLSLVISLISLQLFTVNYWRNRDQLTLTHVYFTVIFAVINYGFHVGIKKQNKKQLNAWFLEKILEIFAISIVVYYLFLRHDYSYIYSIIVIVLDVVMVVWIFFYKRKMVGYKNQNQESEFTTTLPMKA